MPSLDGSPCPLKQANALLSLVQPIPPAVRQGNLTCTPDPLGIAYRRRRLPRKIQMPGATGDSERLSGDGTGHPGFRQAEKMHQYPLLTPNGFVRQTAGSASISLKDEMTI